MRIHKLVKAVKTGALVFCVVFTVASFAVLLGAFVWMRIDKRVTYGYLAAKTFAMVTRDQPWTRSTYANELVWGPEEGAQRVWGYVDKHSVAPGEPFNLTLSTRPDQVAEGVVEIHRVGGYADNHRKSYWKSERISVKSQSLANTCAALGAGWAPTITAVPTGGWPSGYYTLDFVGTDGYRDADFAFIVVTNPNLSGDVLIKIPVNTYQAYNAWGGHSLYKSLFLGDRGSMVSFDRPTAGNLPTAGNFYESEYYFIIWLEEWAARSGIKIDYATNFDMHTSPDFSLKYKLVIIVGHDEYWSEREFDNMYTRIFKNGGNTLFLGANIAFWQIRYADVNSPGVGDYRGRQMVCFKSAKDPILQRVGEREEAVRGLVTVQFRDTLIRKPGFAMLGISYEEGNYHWDESKTYDLIVEDPSLPFFSGTGYKKGDSIGPLLGGEWDSLADRDSGTFPSILPLVPRESIHVLFSGTATNRFGAQRRAEAVYFVAPSGAKVFAAGTLRWVWGLAKPGFASDSFRKLNRNLILDFLKKTV